MAILESMKSLFNKIKLRIRSNPIFSASIYYPSSTHIKGNPFIWINQENNKIYACACMYSTNDVLNDYELTKEFLAPYNYREILRTKYSAGAYKVIYEIQEDNIN